MKNILIAAVAVLLMVVSPAYAQKANYWSGANLKFELPSDMNVTTNAETQFDASSSKLSLSGSIIKDSKVTADNISAETSKVIDAQGYVASDKVEVVKEGGLVTASAEVSKKGDDTQAGMLMIVLDTKSNRTTMFFVKYSFNEDSQMEAWNILSSVQN